MTVKIATVKWGSKYGPEYVNRLYKSIVQKSNLLDLEFWCFTDDKAGIDAKIICHPLPYAEELHTWWNKVWLFSDQVPFGPGDKILYIDLDTLATGDISPLLTADSKKIIVLKDFYQGIARTAGNIGSGLLLWNHGDYLHVWKRFYADWQSALQQVHPHGDQKWLEINIDGWQHWQDLFPGKVVSFKVDCTNGLPDDARIVCYHGKPSIPDSAVVTTQCNTAFQRWTINPQPWVLDYWKD